MDGSMFAYSLGFSKNRTEFKLTNASDEYAVSIFRAEVE
jgi:hypothetical protein